MKMFAMFRVTIDGRVANNTHAQQVTGEPGASTIASVVNKARPSMGSAVNSCDD